MNKFGKLLVVGGMLATMAFLAGCGGDKKPAEPAKPAATAQPAKKEKIRLYTDEQLKKMTPAERAEARKKEYRANLTPQQLRAHLITDKPEYKKFDEMSKAKYPNLKWGSVGYNYKNVPVDGEVIYDYSRTVDNNAPTFTDDKGREVKGKESYVIKVLYGACKGQCVIEATDEHIVRMDPTTYNHPKIEKSTIIPFDKTYVRHEENGKKWVTHEKCGTK